MLDKNQCLHEILIVLSRVTLIEKEGMRTALILMAVSPHYKGKFHYEATIIARNLPLYYPLTSSY